MAVENMMTTSIVVEKAVAPTPVLLPGKSHGRRSLVGCSPWGREESDTTERLHFHFSLACVGEGNGNPLQYSCLENPRDRGAGGLPSVGSQSRTRLKRLSSSSTVVQLAATDLINAKVPAVIPTTGTPCGFSTTSTNVCTMKR